jgi:hypothetical protein
MPKRTRHFVAHFATAFRLGGIEELLPAGAYALDREEELDSAGSGESYRCVGMFMHLAAILEGRWVMQMVPVQPADVELAILQKMEGHDGNPTA